jgi:hypothetical protein
VYKNTGALLAAKLQEVINKGILSPTFIVNEGAVASIILWLGPNPAPYFKAVITEPEIAEADPVPKHCIPAKEPVADCPAVKITPPKFTGIFAMFLFFK